MVKMLEKRFVISNSAFDDALKKGHLYIKGDFYEEEDHCFYFEYYLYEIEKTLEQYFYDFLQDKHKFIKSLKGEFCLVDYDIRNNQLFFATDHLGKEAPFVYHRGERLIITNDFWQGIQLIHPGETDIDWQSIKEMIIHSVGILHSTAVKFYEMMPAASYVEINLDESLKLDYKLYWNFEFHPDKNIRLQDAADHVYEIFDETFAMLAKKYPPETRFGVGFSGGWDSRLIVAYAQKYNMNIVPFCVGEKYSVFPFHTNGYRVVKKLARYFHLDNFTFVSYDSENYVQKVIDDIIYAPIKSSDMSVGCRSAIPEYDVMLDGEHGGVFQGEFDYLPLLDYNRENIYEYLLKFLSFNKGENMVFSQEEKECRDEKLNQYIIGLNSNDRIQIFYRYFFEIMAPRTKCGFFETGYGLKERYSPYLNPDFMDYYLTWDSLFLADRAIQRKLFMSHFEDLSKIADETSDAPLYWRSMDIRNVPKRLVYAARNYIFKSSLRRAKWLKRDKGFHRLLNVTVENNKEILEQHFPDMDVKKFYKLNPRSTANMVKYLIEVDAVLHCQFGEQSEFIEKKYS